MLSLLMKKKPYPTEGAVDDDRKSESKKDSP